MNHGKKRGRVSGERKGGRGCLLSVTLEEALSNRAINEERCWSQHLGVGGTVSFGRETKAHSPKMKTLRRNIFK